VPVKISCAASATLYANNCSIPFLARLLRSTSPALLIFPYYVLFFIMSAISSSATPSRAILGPLITTYIAPSICSNYAEATYAPIAWQAQGCSDGNDVDTSSCWPPALVSAPRAPYFGWGFYSPGLICPGGYVTACTAALNTDGSPSSITQGSSFNFQYPLIPGETAVGCCPRYVKSIAYAENPGSLVFVIKRLYVHGWQLSNMRLHHDLWILSGRVLSRRNC